MVFTGFILGLLPQAAFASLVAFENLPVTNSNFMSHHNAIGPILADDFVPVVGGPVFGIDWWGTSTSDSNWEILFHTNSATSTPNIDDPVRGGQSVHFVTATGQDPDNDGIFQYSALWNPQDMQITAGTTYWVTIANFSPGWNWALGGTPTVGTSALFPQESVGAVSCLNGGPHCGPWSTITTTDDLAFRIHAVPEPATLTLMGLGLVVSAFLRRRR
jgi:hypothetical protein